MIEKSEDIHINNKDWSKLETDHLFRLCDKYGLRFIIIADRFEDDIEGDEMDRLEAEYKGLNKRERKNRDKEVQLKKAPGKELKN